MAYASDQGKFSSEIRSRKTFHMGKVVNPEKSELILLTRRYSVDEFRLLQLDGATLGLPMEAK